jgi:hypothetical protein
LGSGRWSGWRASWPLVSAPPLAWATRLDSRKARPSPWGWRWPLRVPMCWWALVCQSLALGCRWVAWRSPPDHVSNTLESATPAKSPTGLNASTLTRDRSTALQLRNSASPM